MPQKQAVSAVRIVNKAAHLKYLNLGGETDTIAVPPTPEGSPGVLVKFDSQQERERFDKALQTNSVQAWLDEGELEIKDAQVTEALNAATSPAQQVEQSAQTAQAVQREQRAADAQRTAAESSPPARVPRRETGRGE